jgi:hypothetical protein
MPRYSLPNDIPLLWLVLTGKNAAAAIEFQNKSWTWKSWDLEKEHKILWPFGCTGSDHPNNVPRQSLFTSSSHQKRQQLDASSTLPCNVNHMMLQQVHHYHYWSKSSCKTHLFKEEGSLFWDLFKQIDSIKTLSFAKDLYLKE